MSSGKLLGLWASVIMAMFVMVAWALPSHGTVEGSGLGALEPGSIADVVLDRAIAFCGDDCFNCTGESKHACFADAGAADDACDGEHSCQGGHDCSEHSCFNEEEEVHAGHQVFDSQVEWAIRLFDRGSSAELQTFVAQNSGAVIVNRSRRALQILGGCDNKVVAQLPLTNQMTDVLSTEVDR